MTSPRITFTYSSRSVTDPWWVRLEQEDLPDDTATLSDAADLLDTLYNLDACSDEETTEEAADPSTEDVEETVEITVDRMACHFDADGNVDVDIRVIRSRQDAPYRLALQGGILLTAETITEQYTQTIPIESASSITLEYPVMDGFTATWAGAVYGEHGSVDAPDLNRTGNTLDFDGSDVSSGSLTVSYLTTYDRCTVTINGIDGEPGACTARVFFHGLVDELELEIPEASEPLASCTSRWTVALLDYDIECVQVVTVSTRCQCSDDEVATRTYEEVVDCPESVVRCQGATTECRHVVGSVTVPEYVECTDDNEVTGRPGMIHSLSTPAYYEEHCCSAPSFPLPDCPEKKISHKGGMPLSGGARQYYNLYGQKLRITPVSPAGGICGDWTIRQEVRSSNCCDGVAPLVWDTETSPEVMPPNSAAMIGISGGGRYPFVWTVIGSGFQFHNGSTRIVTSGRQVYLSALPLACGTAHVVVTDGCTSVDGYVRSTAGRWTDGCYVLFVVQSKLRSSPEVLRSNIGIDDDRCYLYNDGGANWDYNPAGITYRSVEVSLMRWDTDSWVIEVDPASGHAVGLFGDVLAATYDAAISQIVIPITYSAPEHIPSGAGNAYRCSGSICAWECDT